MKLNDFLTSKGLSMAQFAARVGTTTATISRIANGHVVPRRKLLARIQEETGGSVTANDLMALNQAAEEEEGNDAQDKQYE